MFITLIKYETNSEVHVKVERIVYIELFIMGDKKYTIVALSPGLDVHVLETPIEIFALMKEI